MLINWHKTHVLFFLGSAFALCHCSTAVNTPVDANKQVAIPSTLPTTDYLAMAKKQVGKEKQQSLLIAAERQLNEGQWQQSMAILAQTAELKAEQLNEKNNLLARIDLMRHPTQPAASAPPKQIALLLPLTGLLSGPGEAIREGFMAGYKAHKAEALTHIKTYDTNKGDIATIYQQAITEGAQYVVGPLTKNQVATIAGVNHPVPTLFLNESNTRVQDNSYFFGLSPTNEAIQVALKARSTGLGRALVIAPQSEWGNEVVNAFAQQWREDDGVVVDTLWYGVKDDLNKKMVSFLQITDSLEREKKIKQFLGQQLLSTSSRRQDFDMIFLLAYPSKARQIMPLLQYYYVGNVPVYATSSVYSGNANALKDKDLDGIIFCDMPWVFSHQLAAKNWPEQFNSYNRLYALGLDSFTLAAELSPLRLVPVQGPNSTKEGLYLKPSQQVTRAFEWGQFKQGLAHSLG